MSQVPVQQIGMLIPASVGVPRTALHSVMHRKQDRQTFLSGSHTAVYHQVARHLPESQALASEAGSEAAERAGTCGA